ncbi:penicillin-binding protein [Campylobacterota bacterium]|nr:penicillin-binding protein [Campylobacterota bacterium]
MEKTGKILAIFLLVFLFFVIFIAGVVNTIHKHSLDRGYLRTETQKPFRGAVMAQDGLILASSQRTYSLAFDGRNAANPKLIAQTLSLYLPQNESEITQLLERESRVFLARDLTITEAKNLAHLSRELDRKGAFRSFVQNGATIRYALEITPNEIDTRVYPYGELAQPILGFVQKTSGAGQMGVERFYEPQLTPAHSGRLRAQRDAGGNLIYNDDLELTKPQHGLNAHLTIDPKLQARLETIATDAKASNDAAEVIIGIMDSRTGKIAALATSNRYDAKLITNETLANTKMNAVQYAFEPGSVMKPFILALLLDDGQIGQFDLVRGFNGKFKIGTETITDVTGREWFSAEDVIVFSSNIGIAQLALHLSAYKIFDGLSSFGFSRVSGVDLPYESAGTIPTLTKYRTDIYRATTGYGYGLSVTFVQLLKAYNVFNNNGKIVTPRLLQRLIGSGAPPIAAGETRRVIGESTAEKMLAILRKTVEKGSAKEALVAGVFTAGKTGTAHIASAGGYKNDYHNSFFGFANDDAHRYTIGVLVVDPKRLHFASRTAAPIFADTVKLLVSLNLLNASLTKGD